MISSHFRPLLGALVALFLSGCASTDTGQTSFASSSVATIAPTATAYGPGDMGSVNPLVAKPYFISFRARNALSYGHTFVVFGRLDSRGNVPYDRNGVLIPSMTEVAGLHPASTSNIPYSIGHFLPVPAETGWSDGDTEKQYLLAEYTIPLTEAEYNDVVTFIRKLQASRPVWYAPVYNCSSFVGDIAHHMGLKTPNHLLFPPNYINDMRAMNS